MDYYYYEPTGQVVSKFQILEMTGFNTETACPENLREVGIYPLVDEMKESPLDNPEPHFVKEGEVYFKRNSPEKVDLHSAKAKVFTSAASRFEQEFKRLIQNAGLAPLTVVLFYALKGSNESFYLPGLNREEFEGVVDQAFQKLSSISQAKTIEEIKQLLVETVQS